MAHLVGWARLSARRRHLDGALPRAGFGRPGRGPTLPRRGGAAQREPPRKVCLLGQLSLDIQISPGYTAVESLPAERSRAISTQTGALMIGALVFLFRIIVGLIILAATWFIFDNIHDRNTEIIVATIGLLYSFVFVISRRLQYFGLTLFSFFGRTSSYIQRIPYDHTMRDEVGLPAPPAGYTFLNVLFAALIEILCLFRLFSSLLGRGWDTLSEPIRALLHSVSF